jgi:DnaJ-class molecular chaperone
MTIGEARELLGLGHKATRKQIRAAYHRQARLWHPDRAAPEREAACRARMQQINAAYQYLLKFIEEYQYDLEEAAAPRDYRKWWYSRFATGVYSGPPQDEGEEDK